MDTCLTCGAAEPPGRRFCGECGARLGPARAPRRERKVVTVLFCDLVGSTAAADGADPEDVARVLTPFYSTCRSVIRRFGGTVEKFAGDAVMAAFGAPLAHEDDPERAVLAGVELVSAVARLRELHRLDLAVRVGVNTGEALVSVSARPELGEGMLAGDVVNVAARLQSAAPVGRVLVGQSTYRRTRRLIDFEPHPAVVAKGKADPLEVWVAVGARPDGESPEEQLDASRMIGRARELELLERVHRSSVRDRRPRLVTVVAEPGLGKSRLVRAFGDRLRDRGDPVVWRLGQTPPYGVTVGYVALTHILRAHAGIVDSDPPDGIEAKVGAAVTWAVAGTAWTEQAAWLSSRLCHLVGTASTEVPRDELVTAWARFFAAVAMRIPLVLVVEDLHWADPLVRDFVITLRETRGAPVTIVVTTRPELLDQVPMWGAGPDSVTVSLTRLTDEETATLLTSWSGDRPLAPDLQRELLAQAGGHPLYAREYVRMVRDRPDAGAAPALPDSVQAVVAARIDTLPDPLRTVVRAAAVVGHTCWTGAVASLVAEPDDAVDRALSDLSRRDFLRREAASTDPSGSAYAFTHALVADVAYAGLPRADRARLHTAAGDWHAGQVDDPDTDPRTAAVAHHYEQALRVGAGLDARPDDGGASSRRAATWHRRAAHQARSTDISAALLHAGRACELPPDDAQDRAQRLLLHGDLLFLAGQEARAEEVLAEACVAADAAAEDLLAAHARMRRAVVLMSRGEFQRARQLCGAALTTLERHPPGEELVSALLWAATCEYFPRREDREQTLARVVALLEDLPDAPVSLRVQARAAWGTARTYAGDVAAVAEIEQAADLARQHQLGSDLVDVTWALAACRAVATSARAELETLESLYEDPFLTIRRADHLMLTAYLAHTLVQVGQVERALRLCADAADRFTAVDSGRPWFNLDLCRCYARLVSGADVTRDVEDLVTAARGTRDDAVLCHTLLLAAEVETRQRADRIGDHTSELMSLLAAADVRGDSLGHAATIARLAAAAGRPDLVNALLAELPPGLVFFDHCRLVARAVLAESARDVRAALDLYLAAEVAWAGYGDLTERIHALLGAARCQRSLGRPWRAEVERAGELAAASGARLFLADIEPLLTTVR